MTDMSRESLLESLRGSLLDAAATFSASKEADLNRHLDTAAWALGPYRPLVVRASLTLVAAQAEYTAPADLDRLLAHEWDVGCTRQPWERGFPGRLPRPAVSGPAGSRIIALVPAPSAAQISLLGITWPYRYRALHTIGAAASATTIHAADRPLLLLRAQAEAMKEIALRNSHKPVQLRDGMSGAPRNGTPAALHQQLMDAFETLARMGA